MIASDRNSKSAQPAAANGCGEPKAAARPDPSRAKPREPEPSELGQVLEAARADVTRIGRDALRLLRIRGYRVRARVRARASTVVADLAIAVATVALIVLATVFVVFGLVGGLTDVLFDGRAWAGQLTGGLLVLAAAAAFAAGRRRRSRQRRVAALRQALGKGRVR